ncbi:FapA family protein [Pigmentibacter sp. JX0631]|uniref:FapA family protein n=1 Tax=Pigmentibacter sp. JX0631 TaxID=2976982 RepID=UPI00246901AC|nr:FapA family protein [Pigmentibacter sp. JX0631]WGL59579.1 FapA family protein [Pigmentibacter sp. JX0631]
MNSPEPPKSPTAPASSPSVKKFFQIVAAPDGMEAFIPAKSNISPEVAKLTFEQLSAYLVKLGFSAKPSQQAFQELIQCAASKQKQFEKNFILIKGSPYMPAKPATIKWLNPITMPKDLVRPGIPFGIIKQPTPASLAKTIYGEELPNVLPLTGEKVDEKKVITTHPEFILDKNGEIKCAKGGQAVIQHDGKIDYIDFYTVKDVRPDQFHKVHFPCSVVVKCELQGSLDWVVDGDLTLEEFWSASKIQVKGNVKAKSGIQTNNPTDETKAVQIQGNLEAVFIQSSCFIIEGNVKVEKAILASKVITNGNLECLGDPGKIAGSEIIMNKGTINAKNIGSEKEKPTYVKYLSEESAKNSKVEALSEGTRIQIRKSNIIIKFTQPWPPPNQ